MKTAPRTALRIGLRCVGWCALAYVGLYVANSAAGGYSRSLLVDSNRPAYYRYPLQGPDAIMWEPYVGRWSGRRRDVFGYFFAPLIELDRAIAHPSRYESDPDFESWLKEEYPALRHPLDG